MPAALSITLFFFFFFFPHLVLAVQQSYPSTEYTMDCTKYHPDNEGYVCEPQTPTCETLAYFHVQDGPFSTLNSIATQLFSTIPSTIAQASSLSFDDQGLIPDEGLYIPFTCGCNANFTSHNITYTIRPGDTLAQVANLTYEGLTTCQAIQNANPNHRATDLHVGDQLVFPLRCACPNPEQKLRGIRMLVTYPVGRYRNESVSSVTNMFGITPQEFLAANNITNISQSLFPAVTVLLPFLERPTVPPNASYMRIPPPTISTAPLPASLDGRQHSRRAHNTIAITIPVSLFLLCLIIIGASCFARKVKCRKPSERKVLRSSESGKPIFPSKNEKLEKDLFEGMSDFATYEKLSNYSLDDIKQATQNFSPTTVIKGAVHRGMIKGKVVAIKSMTRDVSKELQILRKVNHMNLVSLLGFCIESPEQAYLVYELAENGSLHDWLHGHGFSTGSSTGSSCTLTFGYRLQIALDVATAMEYIHDHTYPSYVHKDINSHNILLDARMRAKIANFALAKPMEDMEPETRHIVGTQGYMAPEYVTKGKVSTKVDVYAFGVVLLEMLSGEEAIVRDGGREMWLAEAIAPLLSGADARERLKQWMDPSFNNVFPLDCAYSLAILARSCCAEDASARPNAREVAFTLSKLLEACLEWEPSGVFTHKPSIEAR